MRVIFYYVEIYYIDFSLIRYHIELDVFFLYGMIIA